MDFSLSRELTVIKRQDDVAHELAGPEQLASHPIIVAAHLESAIRITRIVEEFGWPDEGRVGREGTRTAWIMAYHLIDQPRFQRWILPRLWSAAAEERLEAWKAAMVEDRIRASEGLGQKYGTQFGWDASGQLSPDPAVEDPGFVDQLRAEIGLPPLAEEIGRRRQAAVGRPAPSAAQIARSRDLFEEMCRFAGWRKSRV